MTSQFNLQRFVDAQSDVYHDVIAELTTGRKRTHWMWFIFPQIAGLGQSEMSRRFAISSRDEAAAYAAHPVLGARLRECTQLVLDVNDRTISEVFGHPDDLKFHSSMTLFSACAAEHTVFDAALDRFFNNRRDALTLQLIEV